MSDKHNVGEALTDEQKLQRFLYVCECSGVRHLGLAKRIMENKNLIRVLFESPKILKKSFWAVEYTLSVDNFFNETDRIATIVRSLAPWSLNLGVKLVHRLCGANCKSINMLQQSNRKLDRCLHGKQKQFANVGFIESWLEDHDLFFEDLKNAVWETRPDEKVVAWAGSDYAAYLLKFDACQHKEWKAMTPSLLRMHSQIEYNIALLDVSLTDIAPFEI